MHKVVRCKYMWAKRTWGKSLVGCTGSTWAWEFMACHYRVVSHEDKGGGSGKVQAKCVL